MYLPISTELVKASTLFAPHSTSAAVGGVRAMVTGHQRLASCATACVTVKRPAAGAAPAKAAEIMSFRVIIFAV